MRVKYILLHSDMNDPSWLTGRKNKNKACYYLAHHPEMNRRGGVKLLLKHVFFY